MKLNWNKQRPAITEAREYFKESGDIDGTLRQLPRHLVAERAIVSYLYLTIFCTIVCVDVLYMHFQFCHCQFAIHTIVGADYICLVDMMSFRDLYFFPTCKTIAILLGEYELL